MIVPVFCGSILSNNVRTVCFDLPAWFSCITMFKKSIVSWLGFTGPLLRSTKSFLVTIGALKESESKNNLRVLEITEVGSELCIVPPQIRKNFTAKRVVRSKELTSELNEIK